MVRPRRNRPVLPPIFTPSRAWIALGVGLLVGLTIIHHVAGKSEQNSEVATAGRAVQDSFVKRIEREVRAEILASQARVKNCPNLQQLQQRSGVGSKKRNVRQPGGLKLSVKRSRGTLNRTKSDEGGTFSHRSYRRR